MSSACRAASLWSYTHTHTHTHTHTQHTQHTHTHTHTHGRVFVPGETSGNCHFSGKGVHSQEKTFCLLLPQRPQRRHSAHTEHAHAFRLSALKDLVSLGVFVELADFVLEPFHGHIVRRLLLLHRDILLVELMTQLCPPAIIPTTTTVVGVIITLTLQSLHINFAQHHHNTPGYSLQRRGGLFPNDQDFPFRGESCSLPAAHYVPHMRSCLAPAVVPTFRFSVPITSPHATRTATETATQNTAVTDRTQKYKCST
jgi:hypothetical protein